MTQEDARPTVSESIGQPMIMAFTKTRHADSATISDDDFDQKHEATALSISVARCTDQKDCAEENPSRGKETPL